MPHISAPEFLKKINKKKYKIIVLKSPDGMADWGKCMVLNVDHFCNKLKCPPQKLVKLITTKS